jgi:beta-galactosidase
MITSRLNTGWEHFRGSLGGPWEVWRADKLNNHFNVPWNEVTLPHSYNALDVMDPDVTYYQGQGWYRTKLKVDNPYPNGRTLLHCEGAGQRTSVYVYTKEAGSHLGGYDEFVVDITEAAAEAAAMERYAGKVPIAIRCDNSRELETIPSDVSDFNLYGGLYRYLNLVYVPAVSLERVHVEPIVTLNAPGSGADAKAVIKVRAKLYNPQRHLDHVTITVRLTDPSGEVIGQCSRTVMAWNGMREIALHEMAGDASLWSTDNPQLYACEVKLSSPYGETVRSERFGLRTFEFVKHGPFKLNGQRLLLRGTHRHEDHAGIGPAMTEEMMRTELQLMKDMGVNFIRLGHYQQSRIILQLCDELGILVWEEIPWCRGGLGGESYKQQCRDMLTAMIEQHYNHTSVILWGLGNENDWEADFDYFEIDQIRAFMKELHDLSHQLDPNRLTSIRRCEFCKDIIDVYSPSIWAGWYRGVYTEYEPYSREAFENVGSFFHMEWGADNLATRHVEKTFTGFEFVQSGDGADERDGDYMLTGGQPRVSKDGDWSETYFCEMIDWYLKCQEKMDWLTGTAQWAFKDFATPVRPDSPIPYLNMKGIIERDFTKKEVYYVFQSYWTDKPMVRIYGHSMPVRWGKPGERKRVLVYSNCETAELFLNGVSQGVKHRDSANFPAAGLRWDTELKPGHNELRVVAVKGGITVQDDISFEYQLEGWGEPAQLRLTSRPEPDGSGRVLVEAAVYDTDGTFCPDACAAFVTFGIAGDGRLVDNQGTVRGSRYIQLANGRARIVMEPGAGGAMVSVSSAGLRTAYMEV